MTRIFCNNICLDLWVLRTHSPVKSKFSGYYSKTFIHSIRLNTGIYKTGLYLQTHDVHKIGPSTCLFTLLTLLTSLGHQETCYKLISLIT